MAKKSATKRQPAPKPTIEEVRKYADQIEAKFGRDANIGYANVSYTQLSIARHYGGCKVQGKHFVYNPVDDSLIREDVVKFIVKLRETLQPGWLKEVIQDTQQKIDELPDWLNRDRPDDQAEFPF
jgi:hypothetical protein